ncbi:MAG TPA: ribosome maturation factor RimP [Acidimicrobiia bacterium]|nr:ribosome maturation factor RimP [Acidimicrobiia bacterium]
MPERADSLAGVIEPVLASLGLELFDLELTGSGSGRILRVLVDRDGGVDLDSITAATEAVSPALDADGTLSGAYALEVSSPGLERPLRRPDHYRRAVGATVTVKTRDDDGAARRVRGVLAAADDDGFTLEVETGPERIAYADVTQARTVFEWGPAPKPAPKRKKKKEKARS